MRFQTVIQYISRFLNPTRVLIALMLVSVLYFLPLNSKPAFIEQNGQILEIAQVHPVLQSVYPQGIYAACGEGGPGSTNCHTGCCSAGQCVVCPPNEDPVPPTISANLNCSNWGDNGWCMGSLSIDLSASDPQGQAVVISGAVNGNNFACPSGATSCSIPLSGEGTGSVSYQVNSATGLSAAGSLGYQIDLSSPDLDTSVSGAAGTNGWYRSDVTLNVSASDATSGIASITASINGGGATTVNGSLTFSDGEYSVLIVTRDNAGHQTQDTQIIKVDTITPSLSFTSSGTNGKNGWYVSSASAAATASDAGSGLASIEASVDGGSWIVSDSISLSDGVHTYQFRATDVAGNKTETPTQTALIDTIAPSISMSQGTNLGEKVLYEIEDYGSGLSIFRAVIEDDGEQYQKVTWSGDISGSYIADDILWDGKFADGARAGIGEYMVTLKITDAAGNKAIKTTFVTVGLLDLLDDIPAFSPPVSSTSEEDEIPITASATGPQTFGGIQTTTGAGEFISTTTTVSGITIPTTDIPIDPNILWGAAATAMVGATLADWQKKREEEARRKAEAQEEKRANTEKRWAQKKAETSVRERWDDQKEEKARQERANNASTARWEGLAKQEEAKQQARINDANAARWAGLAAMEQEKEEEKKAGASKVLAKPVQQDNPPEDDPPEDKSWWQSFKDLLYKIWNPEITPTPQVAPWGFTPSPTSTPTAPQTATPMFTPTPRPTSSYLEDQLQAYGISLMGNIESNTVQTILSAAQLLGKNYMPYTNASTPESSFLKSNGTILFVQDKDAVFFDENGKVVSGNCETRINIIKGIPSKGITYVSEYKINIGTQDNPVYISKEIETVSSTQTIICKETPTLENVQHEFGHTTPNHVDFDVFSKIVSIQTEDGTFIDQHLDGYWERQDFGFLKGSNSLEHKISGDNPSDGYAKVEQLADMLMNWNMEQAGSETHGFSDNADGTARRNFIEDLLKDMLRGQ